MDLGIPTGQPLFIFLFCLALGAIVIVRFCVNQFEKPVSAGDVNDPWKFVVPRHLTSPSQYLMGFSIYCGLLLAIYVFFSLLGPGLTTELLQQINAAATQTALPARSAGALAKLQDYPAFPILIAFIIVGINPSLPKFLDFEVYIRRFAHRMAYIPKNMDGIFNYMRFSEFDVTKAKLDAAWEAVDVRQVALDAPDLKTITPIFNRAILLYARAGTLAGDLTLDDAATLQQGLSLDVFRMYRSQIQDVGVSLQAISSRFSELAQVSPADRKKAIQGAQRDLIKSLEFLYVIFACALTGFGMERLTERLRAIGFRSELRAEPEIPWNPILQAVLAAAVVLGVAWWIAAFALKNFVPPTIATNIPIPTEPEQVIQTLAIILLVHLLAIARALSKRTQLIAREKYYAETGKGEMLAYLRIFASCYIIALPVFLGAKYFFELHTPLFEALTPQPGAVLDPADPPKGPLELVWDFFFLYVRWTIVPALCGAMTAYTIDRVSDTTKERIVSGLLEAAAMAAVAVIILGWTGETPLAFQAFTLVLYGGLGFVLGYILPAAVKRHWAAREHHLPDKIALLRTSVLQQFHDMQQFTQWLYAKSDDLGGKRPLDVLAEDTGPQRLIALVTQTRAKTPAPQP